MDELVRQVLGYVLNAWRFRWQAIVIAWIMALAGWAYVLVLPNKYEAEAKVHLDTETILGPLLEGLAVRTDVVSQVNMMTQALLSRPTLEKVVLKNDLALQTRTPLEYERVIEELRSNIRVTGARGNIYQIKYEGPDREEAVDVVSSLLSIFVEDTLGENRSDTAEAQDFLIAQIGEYETRLQEAEKRLAEFKQRNVGLMPGDKGDYYARLQSAEGELQSAKSALEAATMQREELRSQLAGETPTFGIVPSSSELDSYSPEAARIAELEARLDQLLLRFTEKHPDVISIRAIISDLEEKQAAAAAEVDPGLAAAFGPNLEQNPVYQSMRIALSDVEVQIASLRTRVSVAQQQVNNLARLVDTIPQVEAELARLNRDYSVTRQGYEEFVQRLESARISQNAEDTNNVKFRIIEPPTAALQPVGPNRPLLLSFTFAVALVGGIALAVLLSQFSVTFFDRKELADFTGLPVIGTVRALPSNDSIGPNRFSNFVYSGAVASLFALYFGLMTFVHIGVALVQRVLGNGGAI